MKVLELIHSNNTNFGLLIKTLGSDATVIVRKNSMSSVNLNTYDTYIVTSSFLAFQREEIIKNLFDYFDIHKEKKVYVVFDYINAEFKFIKQRYNITQEMQDSIIVDYEDYDDIKSIYKPKEERFLFCSDSTRKNIKIHNTDKYFVVHVKNITFMIDIDIISFTYSGTLQEVSTRRIITKELSLKLFNFRNEFIEEAPIWAKDIVIFNESELNNEVLKQNGIISAAESKIIECEEERSNISIYKKLLYSNSEELRLLVIDVLEEMFGEKSDFVDLGHEDYLIEDYKSKKIFFEIKGENNSVRLNHISQCETHIRTHAADNGIPDGDIKRLYKGVLVFNPFVKKSYGDRIKDNNYKYSDDVIKDAEIKNICIIDTATLLNIYIDYKNKKLTKEEIFDILLKSNIVSVNHENIKCK